MFRLRRHIGVVLVALLLCGSLASAAPAPERGESISLDLRNTDLGQAFRILAEISGHNIVLHPDVRGSVTVQLRDVSWWQACELIARLKGLYLERKGSLIVVYPLSGYPPTLNSGRSRAGVGLATSPLH